MPTLTTLYTNMSAPTVMVETNGGFGNPTYEIDMKSGSDGNWYKANSASPSLFGLNVAGMFTRERVGSGDRASMAVRSNVISTPNRIDRYSGTGMLQKIEGGTLNLENTAVRLWKGPEGEEHLLHLDFGSLPIQRVDSLENENVVCAIRLLASPEGSIVAQADSVLQLLSVGVVRDNVQISAFAPSQWSSISRADIPEASNGDILVFALGDSIQVARSYTVVEINGSVLSKSPHGETSPATGQGQIRRIEDQLSVYPNPFNPSTQIQMDLSQPADVSIVVFDMLGREIETIMRGFKQAGIHSATFNGSQLPSGVYFCRSTIRPQDGQAKSWTKKILLAK